MKQIYVNTGKALFLPLLCGIDTYIRLFTNNWTPAETDTLGSATEASWTGYSGILLDDVDWNQLGVSGNVARASQDPVTFGNSSGSTQQAYGYYVTDQTNSTLLYACRFDSPPVNVPDGVGYTVIPYLGLGMMPP